MSSKNVGRGVLALLAFLLVINTVNLVKNYHRWRPVSVGDGVVNFSLPEIAKGGRLGPNLVEFSSFRGTVVVIDFWAHWCGACRRVMPVLKSLENEFSGARVRFLSISLDHSEDLAAAAAIASGFSHPSLWDNRGVARTFRVTTIPHIVVVGPKGIIRSVHRGFLSAGGLKNDLLEEINDLL